MRPKPTQKGVLGENVHPLSTQKQQQKKKKEKTKKKSKKKALGDKQPTSATTKAAPQVTGRHF